MSWFTKEEKIPDLPDSNELPRLPDLALPKKENDAFVPSLSNYLPTLPEPNISTTVHNDMQKSRFDVPPEKSVMMIPESKAIRPSIMPSFEPVTEQKAPPKISASMAPSKFETKKSKTAEPIYVRLDKFQETQDSIREIKEKLEEIEINEWEREAQLIKSKLNAIDSNLFSSL